MPSWSWGPVLNPDTKGADTPGDGGLTQMDFEITWLQTVIMLEIHNANLDLKFELPSARK